MHCLESNIEQDEAMVISKNTDEEINVLSEYALSRGQRKMSDEPMNEIEHTNFVSVSSSEGLIRSAASILCIFYASPLQNKDPQL